MERNDNFGGTGAGGAGGASGAGQSGFGATGGASGGTTGGSTTGGDYGVGGSTDFGGASVGSAAGSQSFGTTGGAATGGSTTTGDKLRDAKSAAADKLGALKGKASNLSANLADRLEAGAEKLRQRGQTNQFAGVGGETSVGATDDQMAALTNRLAGGLQGTADALRNGDLKGSIETQVRDNPARTLLIAVGVGYLLGKAFKK